MDKSVFARRRRGIVEMMGEGIAIIPTAPEHTRNNDVHFQFRPDSDFFYLTQFPEPEAVAVLAPGREHGEFVMFCREKNHQKEIWDGRRAGLEGAMEDYGADDAYPIEDIDDILPGLLENRSKVFSSMGRYKNFDTNLINWVNEVKTKVRSGINAPNEFVCLDTILHEHRLIKKVEELRIMKRAGRISAAAHCKAMRFCKPGKKEYQVQAVLEHEFKIQGCQYTAYPPIVAGGANACILHYTENSEVLKDGDLLLIDAGAELDCYASDITRTMPINGKFSAEQKTIYDIVLQAQHAAIEQVKPGNHWNQPHEAAVKTIVEGLIDLKVLKGTVEDLIENQGYRRFYIHRTGHWLGMDVHDVGDYKIADEWRLLEPGMVFTVEPGLYFPDDKDVDPRWRNIGIRIEDNVVVSKEGATLITDGVPRKPEDIEAMMAD